MPQASEQLTNLMIERFGDDYLEKGPCEYLLSHGYTLNRHWEWQKPGVNELRDMTRDEFDCLLFMMHEWDYGGLAKS